MIQDVYLEDSEMQVAGCGCCSYTLDLEKEKAEVLKEMVETKEALEALLAHYNIEYNNLELAAKEVAARTQKMIKANICPACGYSLDDSDKYCDRCNYFYKEAK